MRPRKVVRLPRHSLTRWIVLIGLLVMSGCTHSGRTAAGPSGPDGIRVGVNLNRPPMAFGTPDAIRGLEPELARKAGQELGRPVSFVALKPDQRVEALERGQVDAVMGSWSRANAAPASIMLSRPYLRGGERVAIRKEDLSRLGPPGGIHLPGVRIGYTRHSPGEEYAREHLNEEDIRVYAFDSTQAALRSLRARRIDFVIGQVPGLGWLIEQSGDLGIITLETPLTEEDFSWAVSSDNPELVQSLDRILDQWRAQDELRRTIDRWIPAQAPFSADPSGRQGTPIGRAHGR